MNIGEAATSAPLAGLPVSSDAGTAAAAPGFQQLVDGASGMQPIALGAPAAAVAMPTGVSAPQLLVLAEAQPAKVPGAAADPAPTLLDATTEGAPIDGAEPALPAPEPQPDPAAPTSAPKPPVSNPPAATAGAKPAGASPAPVAAEPTALAALPAQPASPRSAPAAPRVAEADSADGDEDSVSPDGTSAAPAAATSPTPAATPLAPPEAARQPAAQEQPPADQPGKAPASLGSQGAPARRVTSGGQTSGGAKPAASGSAGSSAGSDFAAHLRPGEGAASSGDARQSAAGAPVVAASAPADPPRGTAPLSPSAQPVVSARVGQLGHEMGVEIARRASEGGSELIVRLDPKEMGRIEVRMAFEDGAIRAVVAADSPAALEMLRRDSADLNRALADAGVRTDAQSFRFDSRSGGRDGGQPQQQSAQQDRGASSLPADAGELPGSDDQFSAVRWAGRVHLMA